MAVTGACTAAGLEEMTQAEMRRLYDKLNPLDAALETDERELLVPVFIRKTITVNLAGNIGIF